MANSPIDFSDLGAVAISDQPDFSDLGAVPLSKTVKPIDFSDLGAVPLPPRAEPPADLSRVRDASQVIRIGPDYKELPAYNVNETLRPDTTGIVGRTLRTIGERLQPITPTNKAFPRASAADIAAGNFSTLLPGADPVTGESTHAEFAPSAPAPTAAKIAAGVQHGLAGATEAVVPFLIGGQVTSAVRVPLIARGISAAFAADMARQLPDQAQVFYDAVNKGDAQTAAEAAVGGTVGAIFSALALHHAVGRTKVPRFDATGNPIIDPATGKQSFDYRGLAEESPAVRSLLTRKITTEYTPEQIKDVYGRVNRGEANPAEQELVRFINTALERPGEAARKGATVEERIPIIESQFWRDYIGLKEGERAVTIPGQKTTTTRGADAIDPIEQRGSVQEESPRTVSQRKAITPPEPSDSVASPAGQPTQRPNAPAQAALPPASLPEVGDWIQFQEGWPNPRTITAQVVRLANNPVPGGEPIVPVVHRSGFGEQPAVEWFDSGKVVPSPLKITPSTETPSETLTSAEQTLEPPGGLAPPPPVSNYEQNARYRWSPIGKSVFPEVEGYLYNDPVKSGVVGLIGDDGEVYHMYVKDGSLTKIGKATDAGREANAKAVAFGFELLLRGNFTSGPEELRMAYEEFKKRWKWKGNDPGGTYEQYRKNNRVSADKSDAVKEAIADAKKNGPSPEFRALFGGIQPEIAGTTFEKVAAFAASIGIDYRESDWKTQAASPSTSTPGGGMSTKSAADQKKQSEVNLAQEELLRKELEPEAKPEKPKSSTQLTVPKAEAEPFKSFAQSIPDLEVYHKPDATGKEDFGIETAPHITVLYGLTGHDPSTVANLVTSKRPITVELGKLSIFEAEDYDVLKVDVQGAALRGLNKEISRLPNEQTYPKYTPHLTIAYLKKGEGKKYVGDKRFEGLKLTFPSVTFSPPSEIRAKTGVTEIPFAQVQPKPEVSPIGDKPAAPSEPFDTLGNPESFYATKSLMGAQMRRSPKLAAAMKFYQATSVKRLNELATRRFAEMRERAAAPPPVVEPEPKPAVPPPPPKKPKEAPPVAPVEDKAAPAKDSTEFDRLIIEQGPELGWAGDWDTLGAGQPSGGSTMAIEGKKRYSKALQALRRYAASAIGAEQSDMDSINGRAAALPALRKFLEGGMEAGVQTEIPEDASTDFLPDEPKPEKPALELDKPESVEEQSARLAAEDADRKAKAAKEKVAEKAAAPLKGTTGDLGQGDLLDAPEDLFAPPAPKKKASLGAVVAQPMTQSAVEEVVKGMMGGVIPKNFRFVNNPNLPRATIDLRTGEIELNLTKMDSVEAVRDTVQEELIHAVWDAPEIAAARKTIEDLVTEVDRQRQAEEGYNPNETQEEAANERARRINADSEKANIFLRAWRAIVEAIKKLFGVRLNADESARTAARTIVREAMKNQATERPGVMGAEPVNPTPAEKAVLESLAFKRNLDLADELGKIVPEEGETGVPTKVGNVEDMVLTRPGLNAAVRDDSVATAASVLREAGLNIVRADDGLWDLSDRVTNQDMAGNTLVPILEREIQAARANNRPERIANLLNTVVVHLARDGNGAFSQTVKDQLYALAQSERSAYGRALGGLAMWGNVLANIAQSPALHLHRIYSKAVGGPEVEGIIKKLLTVFRDFFSPEEIRKALNPLNLNETARRLIQLKDRDTGGRVYRQVQQRLRGTPPKTVEQKNRRAVEDDAIESLIRQAADLGHIEPPKPKNQKLTADEQLKLLSNPAVAAKVQQATEIAVQNAEFNAGWKAEANAAKGDEEAMADVAERNVLGEDPSPEMIEAGLNLPEFAHWKDIRDNFLDYSPTTLKVVQGVIKGRFKGAKFGVTEPKPAEFRIDFKKLAVEPDSEVQRVFDAQVAAVQALMDKATPGTVARLSAIFRQNIEEQLARHRKETVDKLFAEKPVTGKSITEIEALKKQINAGLLRDQRLSDAELAQRAADRSTLRNVLPSVTDLVERIVTAPRYKMADIKADVAAALVKELGLTDEAAANLSDLVYRALDGTDAKPGPLREAARKALEQVQTALSPADRKILFKKGIMSVDDIRGRKPGRTLWELIERGARAGLFDPTPVLETMARAIGFKVPTAEEKARMKSWAEEEIRLRAPTQRQIDTQQGTAEEKLAKATRAAEAGTESDRLELIRKIQANWSRWSMPIGLRNFLDPTIARNNAKAINEFVAANLLAKAGFFFRQGLDVGVVSMPLNAANRALAHVLERAENAGGFNAETIKDLDNATKELVTARMASFRATIVAAGRTAAGHTNRKVLDRMNHSVGVFERMRAKADDLEAQGNLAGARAMRVATVLQIGYRIAMTWDTIQSVGSEWQEMRQQLSTDLRRAGKTHAEIAAISDDIFGSIKLDMAESVAEVNAIAVEKGLTKSKSAVQADAWGLIKAKAYDRMRTAAGTTTDYEAENEQYKELHSWNLPETGGVGGVIAETIKTIKKNTEKHGWPTGGLFSFGNAMGIAANRMLTFSGGGLFGGFGFGDSPWYQGTRNQRQRRLEAIEGLTAIAIVIALAAAGKLLIQTKYPKDKDEKEKFIADGHKLNTLRWTNDDGSWLEYPIQMSPFGFIASPLYMVGGVQRLLADQKIAQVKLDAEAARTGKVAGKAKAVDAGDVMGVIAQGVYGMLTGGRTASGAIQSFTDYGDFKLNKAVSGIASPYIPGLPAWQEAARAMGAAMDTRTANVLELLVPTPWSGHQRVNSLGDPLTNPNAVSRLTQVMSGGIGWGDGSLPDDQPYRTLVQAGYSAPAVNPNKGYDFGGTIRPMTGTELEAYTAARGEAFKQELSSVNVDGMPEDEARKAVQSAYQRANRTALASVGVTVPASARRAAAGASTSGAQTPAGAPVAARGLGVSRQSSRLGPARGNATLRFAQKPSRGVRLPSRRGSLRLGVRKGPRVRRRGTLRLPGRSGSLRLRRPRVRQP